MLGVQLLQMFQCKGRPGAITQQPFQTRPVGAFDNHRGIHREPVTMVLPSHFLSIALFDQSATDEGAQKIVPARTAVGACIAGGAASATREDAAFEIAAKCALDMVEDRYPLGHRRAATRRRAR